MRALLLLVLMGYCLQAVGQGTVFLYKKDSVDTQFPRWRLTNGDKPEYAFSTFDDAALPEVYSSWFNVKKDSPTLFTGLGWMRLHFRLDTGLANKPLAICMEQEGACELYLDGRKVYSRGIVGDAAHSKYFDPHYYPVPIIVNDTAPHLFAMRYANWNYNKHNYLYEGESPGFRLIMKKGGAAIDDYISSNDLFAVVCSILFGIFGTLALIHILFFLYYKAERSNLWFSLFSGSLALTFFLPFMAHTLPFPKAELIINYYSFFPGALACFALSGLLSLLFSKSRLRFIILSSIYLLSALTYIFIPNLTYYPIPVMVSVAMLDALIVITAALVRKVPGSRIIGTGLFLFVLLALFIVYISVFSVSLHVNGNTMGGFFIFVIASLALLSIPVSLSAFLARRFSTVSRDLNNRLHQVEVLSRQTREQEVEKQQILEHQKEDLERQVAERTREVMRQKNEIERQHTALIEEKKKSDDLLLNILPSEVAEELKQKGSSAARNYEQVSVLFTDFVNFTGSAEEMDPEELVQELNECFTAFDAIVERNGLEKIKTIGDAYMAVCGLPVSDADHGLKTVRAAIEIRNFMLTRAAKQQTFSIRMGINSGAVIAGIVGIKKFAYDIWGDTVNTAARMEQHGEPGKINISSSTYELVKDQFACTARGKIPAKNKGEVEMYFAEI